MDMEKIPSFQEFLKLLNENGRDAQAQDLSLMAWYLDGMERQFNAVLVELNSVKAELAQVTEQQAPSKPLLTKMMETLEAKVEQARDALVSFQSRIIEYMRDAADRFKDTGVSALDHAVDAMGVKKGLEHLQNGVQNSIFNMQDALDKAEEMGTHLRRGFQDIANAGRIAVNKEIVDPTPQMEEGRFQSVILAPMRGMQKMLSNINNNTLAAIGAVEDLELSADLARDRQAERAANKPGRRLQKKPSIRQTLAEKKTEAAARSALAPEKEHKPQEAAL